MRRLLPLLAILLFIVGGQVRADSQFGAASGVLSIGGKRGNVSQIPVSIVTDAVNKAGDGMRGPLSAPLFIGGVLAATDTNTTALGTADAPSTATASILHNYGFVSVYTSFVRDIVASSDNAAEQTAVVRMNATRGGAGIYANYKMAFGAETTCGTALSAPCWGMTTVVTANFGYDLTKNSLISLEPDGNNYSGADCGDVDYGVTGHPCGLVYATAPSNSGTFSFGYGVAGAGRIRNGIVFFSGGPIASSVRDYSTSQNSILDSGAHAIGYNASAATFANAFLIGPGSKFYVLPGGATVAASFTTSGAVTSGTVTSNAEVTAPFVQVSPLTYATLNSVRPCNSDATGKRAYITDSPTTTFNAAVAPGGGTSPIGVGCNGTAWVVGG